MSNRYLAVLVPHRQTWAFGQDGAPKKITRLLPDHTTQSPRLYSVLSKGGGVLMDPDAARTLVAAGYAVTTFKPTAAERAYLVAIDPSFAAEELWLATCDGIAVRSEDGTSVRCVYPGLRNVPESTARAATTSADHAPAKRWVPAASIAGWRYFGSDVTPPTEIVAKALETVRLWNQIAARSEELEKGWIRWGKPMPAAVQTRWVRAVGFLAESAQPVAVIKKAFPDKTAATTATFGTQAAFGFVPAVAAALGISTATLVAIGVVALSVGAGLIYMASKHGEAVKINAEMQDAYNETVKPAIECLTDPSRTKVERKACRAVLDAIKRPAPPKTTLEQFTELAPYIAGLAGLGFAAAYLGPVLREASVTGAVGIERFRQRRFKGE